MENLSMCRMCLTTDVRLCPIASHLRDMYERITSVTFKREDRRPLVACYICHARLQNCNRLRNNCLRSEELLTEMMSSGVLKPQDMLSTNTFRVVSAVHLSVGHALQVSTECHVKEEPSEVVCDAELDQLYTEGAENLKEENIKIEIDWEPDVAGLSSQSADDPKRRRQATEKISLETTSGELNRNKEAEAEFGEPGSIGARVSKKPKIAALKDTEDASTKKRKIEVVKSEQTETVTIKEPKMITKTIEIEIPLTPRKILKTCDKADINLNKCDDNILTSAVIDCEQKSTNDTFLEQNVSSVSSRKIKPFSCDTCNKCFRYIHKLKVHTRTHTGEKPYQCNVCNKCFGYKHHLKDHIRTHTGEKPYQCNVCNKCSSDFSTHSRHIRIHNR